MKFENAIGIMFMGIALLMGIMNYQIFMMTGGMEIIEKNIKTMNDNLHEEITYQVGQVRSNLLANGTAIDTSRVNGLYFPTTMNILIYSRSRPVNQVHSTALHEIGHYIYREKLTREQSSEWLNTTFDCYPSDYAKENPSEHFAESYMYWYSGELNCTKQLDFLNSLEDIR